MCIRDRTNATARKVGNNIFKFLKNKLRLSINREKSGIRRPVQFICLGFGFVPTYVKGERGKYQLVVSEKSWGSLKQKLKTITRKTTPMSFDERIEKLGEVQRGWVNAFRMASIHGKLKELDGWLRNRLCLLYTSDAADERSSVDLGGRRTIKKKKKKQKKKQKKVQ